MVCRKCGGTMTQLYRFVDNKSMTLYQCTKCYFETKPLEMDYEKFNKRYNQQMRLQQQQQKNKVTRRYEKGSD